jgi:Ciliary basal body-associated, B9 protein
MADLGFIQKEIELRQNLAGNKFIIPPLMGGKVNIIGELVYAENFEEDNLYIFLETKFGEEWEYNKEDYDDPQIRPSDESDLINRSRSITQVSKAIPVGSDRKPVSYFSFPLAWSFIAGESGLKGEWPKVCVQVNSLDSSGKHKIQGYGFLEFPSRPGFYKISVPTCRPIESLYSEVHSFYLGGSVRVEDPWTLSKTFTLDENGENSTINRYGFTTQTGGDVVFQLNVVVQTNEELLRQIEIAGEINRKQKKELKWKQQQRKNIEMLNREELRRFIN